MASTLNVYQLIEAAKTDLDSAGVLADYFEEQGDSEEAEHWRVRSERKNPRRVQIVNSPYNYFRKGEFGYVVGYSPRRLYSSYKDVSERRYLVAKNKSGTAGSLWFAKDDLRFTQRRGKSYKPRRLY